MTETLIRCTCGGVRNVHSLACLNPCPRGVPYKDDTAIQVARYIEERQPVFLFYNDETGDWQWAVAVVADPDFWLDAFPTEGEARAFCAEHQLPLLGDIHHAP